MEVIRFPIENGLTNQKVKVKSLHNPPKAPSHLFGLHTLGAFIGSCGSGKTNAIVLLARDYIDYDCFNRIFVISPTYSSNDVWQALPEIGEDDVYTNVHEAQASITQILDKISYEVELWKSSQMYSRVWLKWMRNFENEDSMTGEELQLLESMNYTPAIEYKKPSPVLIIDDMSHSNLFQNSPKNPFINLCLRHRHIHGVGLTIFICVQNFRTGIPKCLRQNIRQFFIFPTKDTTQTDAVYEEVGNIIDHDSFYQFYEQATRDSEHDFLTIDTMPQCKSARLRRLLRFRKNFDEYLVNPSSVV